MLSVNIPVVAPAAGGESFSLPKLAELEFKRISTDLKFFQTMFNFWKAHTSILQSLEDSSAALYQSTVYASLLTSQVKYFTAVSQ